MGLKLKDIKVKTVRYHIYNGDKEVGDEYFCKPEDAINMAENGYVELVEKKDKREEAKGE